MLRPERDPEVCRLLEISINMKRNDKHYEHLARVAGTTAAIYGVATAVRTHGVTKKFAEYWRDKLLVPGFHNGTVGGARNRKFNDLDQKHVEVLLFAELKRAPRKKTQEFAISLQQQGYNVDRLYEYGWPLILTGSLLSFQFLHSWFPALRSVL
jgi:hypothetical protein